MSNEQLTWDTVDSSIVYTCDGFDVINQTVKIPPDVETEFDYIAEGESVVIIPLTPAGEVVVIEEWRQSVRRVNYGLPAGSLEPTDNNPAAAVSRELEEETGYLSEDIEHLTTVEPVNGFADSVYHYFLARECIPAGKQDLDEDESIQVRTTTVDSLLSSARNGDLRDGRAMLGILYLACFEFSPERNS